jgi:hypothetical protein
MVNACLVLRLTDRPSGRQRSIRRRTRHLSLRTAVRLAADAFFRFTYRSPKSAALWSSAERVWLGRQTFLHWALWDASIDIPWVVAETADVPPVPDDFRAAVDAELAAYWERQLASLPRKGKPCWLPLP